MDLITNARIWLSGSIEKPDSEEGQKIARFVEEFATAVFQHGGTLVHGCHPTILKPLLTAASAYTRVRGHKPNLALLVSRYYSKEPEKYKIDISVWNTLCSERVIETPEALEDPQTKEISRSESLTMLRQRLLDQANVIVAIGGKWWDIDQAGAGVPEEIELARTKNLPLFLLGGLSGATRGYLSNHRDLLHTCRNGLNEELNVELAGTENPNTLAKTVVESIARLPLPDRTAGSGRPFRILCLDGGGICGTFTASVLDYWERTTGRNIATHFDLIAGTSTGGILAIGLGIGLRAEHLLNFYKTDGTKIFPNTSGTHSILHSIRHWFESKFDQGVLETSIQNAFAPTQKTHLNQSRTRLLVPAYDSVSDQMVLFRTPHGSNAGGVPLWECVKVALATSAAPTYFNPVQIGTYKAIDGGVWANSPTTAAYAEAVHELGISPDRIEILSVGTTYGTKLLGQPMTVDSKFLEALLRPFLSGLKGWVMRMLLGLLLKKPKTLHGILGWLPNIAAFLMKAQAQTSGHVIERILGERYVRVDEPTLDLTLDDSESISLLTNLGIKAAEREVEKVRKRFLNGVPADPWSD